jgi:hypothetical protein
MGYRRCPELESWVAGEEARMVEPLLEERDGSFQGEMAEVEDDLDAEDPECPLYADRQMDSADSAPLWMQLQ